MDNHQFKSYLLEDRSYTAFVKGEIRNQATASGFIPSRIAEIDIVISEVTSNLIKHAGRGELLYRFQKLNGAPSLEVICIDNGPGISNIPLMMKDGMSTKGTLGQGLGAIKRLSNSFQVYSQSGWGTLIYVLIHSDPVFEFMVESASLFVPKPAETVSGDDFCILRNKNSLRILFGDGLGHGQQANEAVKAAIHAFKECDGMDPVAILRHIHADVKKTRGLVATIAILDYKLNQWIFCGVGNIMARLYNGLLARNIMPYNGIIGLNIPHSLHNIVVQHEPNQHLVMCSDGIRSRFEISNYPGIFKYNAAILASAIYKDYNRKTDDSSVFIFSPRP